MKNIQAKDSSTQSNSKVKELTPTEKMAKMKEEALRKGVKGLRFQKTPEQVEIMTKLYEKHGINICQKMGGDAVKATGLRWKQIYKWIYDMHNALENLRNFETGKPAKIFNIRKDFTRVI